MKEFADATEAFALKSEGSRQVSDSVKCQNGANGYQRPDNPDSGTTERQL